MDYNEIARFLSGLPPESQIDSPNPDAPLVVFPSENLVLTKEQEEVLTEEIIGNIAELESELGRDKGHEEAWYQQEAGDIPMMEQSFIPKRQLAEMTYAMRMEWRSSVVGGIFEEHNLTIPLTRRIVQQQHSRANGYFFSTDPWFSVDAVGQNDDFLSDRATKYARFKFDQFKIKEQLIAAVESAFKKGEQVLKPAFVDRVDLYESFETVAVDPAGQPLFANDGDYLFEDDKWVQAMGADSEGVGGVPIEDETGIPVLVLKRDPSTMKPPEALVFQRMKVPRQIELESGVEMGLVYYKDFLCSLSAKSVQTAPCVVHFYDKPAFDIVHDYLADKVDEETGLSGQDFANVIGLLNDWQAADGSPKAYQNRQRASLGETSGDDFAHDASGDGGKTSHPVVEIAEVYLYCDPIGDGRSRHIMCLFDVANQRPIFYDYVANVTPDGKRPFHVVRIDPVEGRWHGVGQCETFAPLQEFADLTMNRWSQSQSSSGWIDVVNPDAVEEGDDDGNIEINGGDVFHLKKNFKAEDFLTRINLYDSRSDNLQETLEYIQQWANSMGGVSNTNDNRMAGLDSAKLATGIRNIEKSGQEMFAPWLNHMDPGLTGACAAALILLFDNLHEPEVFEFFEGDYEEHRVKKVFAEITPDEVKDLDINVKLELSRYRAEAQLAQNMQAEEVVTRYYALPYLVQVRARDLFVQVLKALQITRADEMIVPTDLFQPPSGAPMPDQQGAVGAVNPTHPPQPNM